jgi:purine-nucleoside/S-methyl-5'-thioadenosine phosphorylase / adenosine deaminase
MELTSNGKIQYLEPGRLAACDVSVQGFTTRHGGVSRPPYNSLNLGITTLDSPHNVMGNRSLLARAMGTRVEQVVTATQVHGTDLLVIDAANNDFAHFLTLEADGIVTDQPGVLIGVCVADCVPLILLDPVQRVAAALHAGWKGTARGIAGKGVEAMVTCFGSSRGDIRAAVGPGIGSCCYEVDAPVREAFRKSGEEWHAVAEQSGEETWRLDLAKANFRQLIKAGVKEEQIDQTSLCSSCNPELFYSYRRDQGDTGRQMGFIMLKG